MNREMNRVAVLEAENNRCRAMLAGDVDALARLLDERLHFSHANGAIDDKQAYLAKIKGGRIVYSAIEWSEQKVIDLGQVALLAGRMLTLVRVDGMEKRLENRVLSVWVLLDEWQLAAFQSTPLTSR